MEVLVEIIMSIVNVILINGIGLILLLLIGVMLGGGK